MKKFAIGALILAVGFISYSCNKDEDEILEEIDYRLSFTGKYSGEETCGGVGPTTNPDSTKSKDVSVAVHPTDGNKLIVGIYEVDISSNGEFTGSAVGTVGTVTGSFANDSLHYHWQQDLVATSAFCHFSGGK